MPNAKCNVGRIIVNKNITKIGELAAKNNLFSASFSGDSDVGRYVIDKKGKIVERKKKGRLYSLNSLDPPRKQSQLVRLKTVGTFDLCMEVTALACGFNDSLLSELVAPTAVPPVVTSATQPTSITESGSIDNTPAISVNTTPSNKHISTSENSLKLDDSLKPNKSPKSRSLSTSSYLINEDYLSSVSTNFENLELNKDTSKIIEKSTSSERLASNSEAIIEDIITEDAITEDLNCETKKITDSNESDDSVFTKGIAASTERRRTLKKCERIVRTDSELFKDDVISKAQSIANEYSKKSSNSNSFEEKENKSKNNSFDDNGEDYIIDVNRMAPSTEDSSRNMSCDTVFSDSVDPIDLDKLEKEYKEHLKSNLQREYKSDGDGLDEVGKKRHQFGLWKNQSIDFNFLDDDDDVDEEAEDVVDFPLKKNYVDDDLRKVPDEKIKIRKDDENRTRSEGDKDMLCEIEQKDSFETQESTEEEQSDKTSKSRSLQNQDTIEELPERKSISKICESHSSKLTLFEKRFGKFRKMNMNQLLKVKRFSTSALYDRKKSDPKVPNIQKTSPVQSASKQDLSSSKMSLQSPKSLKNKKFLFKKRKFSFFGKSQSNNDLNLNLKSLASKISLISKSNFDISGKISSSNNRLNAVGVTGKYSASNEYRSDILQCTSPLSEAFYNATGSYQLSAMELFEKFCSTDFTGLYKHEPANDTIEEDVVKEPIQYSVNDPNWSHKGAIKKCSLRKATLLKQNSEPKFCLKNVHVEDYAGYKNFQSTYYNEEEEDVDHPNFDIQEREEFPEEVEDEQEYPEEGEYYATMSERRKSSFSRQFEFEQPDEFEEEEYFEDQDGQFYITGGEGAYRNQGIDSEVDEIYLMPEKHRFGEILNEEMEEDIIIIDEIDELEEDEADTRENQTTPIISKSSGASSKNELRREYEENKDKVISLYKIYPKDEELSESESRRSDDEGSLLKNIISDYVKNALTSEQILPRTKSVELLSNSSETVITNSNSEFDTVKQLHLDSCSTSRLSLSLKSDIFDDFTIAPPDTIVKTININDMDDFTITPDGSLAEKYETSVDGSKLSEQDIIKNELQSQYTIIDFDEELENDDDSEATKYDQEKSSFADALNKEFDKLFTKARTQTSVEEMYDTDVSATTPSIATTVVTAIKIPSRCSMEKLEPYTIDASILDEDEPEIVNTASTCTETNKKMSQSMTSTCESLAIKREEISSSKSKRSHSLGNIHKRKSNKCTPL